MEFYSLGTEQHAYIHAFILLYYVFVNMHAFILLHYVFFNFPCRVSHTEQEVKRLHEELGQVKSRYGNFSFQVSTSLDESTKHSSCM